MKRLWKDPTYRAQVTKGRSEQIKKLWTDPTFCLMFSKSKKQFIKKMVAHWNDPEFHAKMCKVRKEQVTDKERKRLGKLAQANWNNNYKKMCKARKKQATPERNEANSIRTKRLWQDPKYRKRMMKVRNKTMYNNPTWIKNQARASRKAHKGVPGWNKGKTKYDTPSLMATSLKLKGKLPKYNKFKSWYPDIKHPKIEMRSSWEVKFALWLDEGNIRWEYESKKFHVGRGKGKWSGETYTPDFYLPDQDVHVELKGYLSKQNKNKMEAFHNLYPDIKLWMFQRQHLGKVLEFKPKKKKIA